MWEFEEGKPLIAMYGKTKGSGSDSEFKIKQLGWVTLDEQW